MAADSSVLRADLVEMLMHDRQSALLGGNPGAAIQASARVVDLMLGRLAEEAKDVSPITELTMVIVHQHLCIGCRERLSLPGPPVPEVITEAERQRLGGWEEPEADPDAEAAVVQPEPPRSPADERAAMLAAVPMAAGQKHKRRREGDYEAPIVKGLS